MSSAAVQSTALPRHCVSGCTSGRVGISALRPMQLFFCWWDHNEGVSALVQRHSCEVALSAGGCQRGITWSTQRVKSSSFSVSFETMH